MPTSFLRRTPQLTDDMIMAQRRPGGLAVDNTQGVLAHHGAQQAASDRINEAASSSLDLGKQRLEQRGRFFGDEMEFAKEQFSDQKQDNLYSNIISAANVGVSGYGLYQQGQRNDALSARRKQIQETINKRYANEQAFMDEIIAYYRKR